MESFLKQKIPTNYERYAPHLGIKTDRYGASFDWRKPNGEKVFTVWNTLKEDTIYFQPSERERMINYGAENLEELLKILKEVGEWQINGELRIWKVRLNT